MHLPYTLDNDESDVCSKRLRPARLCSSGEMPSVNVVSTRTYPQRMIKALPAGTGCRRSCAFCFFSHVSLFFPFFFSCPASSFKCLYPADSCLLRFLFCFWLWGPEPYNKSHLRHVVLFCLVFITAQAYVVCMRCV